MKAAFAFLFLILFSFKGFSQFELPKKTISIAPVSNPKGAVSPTSSKAITYPSIFDKKDKLGESVSLLKKKPEEEKSIFEKEQFASPAKVYTDKKASISIFLQGEADPIVDPTQFEIMKANFAITKTMTDEELKGLEDYMLSIK